MAPKRNPARRRLFEEDAPAEPTNPTTQPSTSEAAGLEVIFFYWDVLNLHLAFVVFPIHSFLGCSMLCSTFQAPDNTRKRRGRDWVPIPGERRSSRLAGRDLGSATKKPKFEPDST